MLSKRMTAKSLELKPASQARNRTVKDSRDCHPAGCDRPPDRPPPPPPPDPAVLPLSPTAVLLRPFPEYDAPELSEDLCLLSETGWCSAIFYVSPVVASKRCELSFMTQERKAPPPSSFSLPRSTSETTCTTLPTRPRSPPNTVCEPKLSNLASHQPQRELSSPRESHSSTVLQHTRSDTCG